MVALLLEKKVYWGEAESSSVASMADDDLYLSLIMISIPRQNTCFIHWCGCLEGGWREHIHAHIFPWLPPLLSL